MVELVEGLVEIGRKIRYRILAADRVKRDYGSLVSRTTLARFEGTVTVYDGGKVVISSERGRVVYDLESGSLSAGE